MECYRKKIIVMVAHPREGSFNHAIAETAAAALRDLGHEVIFHDLYREEFDPLLPDNEIPRDGDVDPVVLRHCGELQSCDGIIIIHPNWWGQPPAILKGWIDRVIRPGAAYEFEEGDSGEGVPVGLLAGKTALVLNTSNTPEERERVVFGDPLELLWRNCIFEFCGVSVFYRKMFRVIVTSTAEQRSQWLSETRDLVRNYFPGT
ncbi:MAG: NAD(P)H-dependent oxidoreductase [Spirochaetes bacterium]|nr:NAD(P)H-dependent oxidoreductase [Spirochaetota bacterium]